MKAKSVKKFWGYVTAFRVGLSNALFLLVIIAVVAMIGFGDGSPRLPDSALLVVNPKGVVVEQKAAISPIDQLTKTPDSSPRETRAREVIDAVLRAKTDKNIKGIVLNLIELEGGSLPLLNQIGEALLNFRAAEKKVYAYAPGFSQSQYFLASFADKIFLDSNTFHFSGGAALTGFGVYPFYMKEALDKLGVNVTILRAGSFKSAAEPLERNEMSKFAREANQTYIDDLWEEFLQTISSNRGIDFKDLQSFIDQMPSLAEDQPFDPAQKLVNAKLLDGIISTDEWREKLKIMSNGSDADEVSIGYEKYLAIKSPRKIKSDLEKVAVIVAKGNIIQGDHPPGAIGGDSLTELIEEAGDIPLVKAVVMRIDTGGGSPEASEKIRLALSKLQENGVPIVVSMGQVTASGGYWIASTADKIVAERTTITGSIGVIGWIPSFARSLEYLGLNVDGVGTTDYADPYNPFREPNGSIIRLAELSVERIYSRFLGLVSEGRDIPYETVKTIAQGRVWSAKDALEHKLVDQLGTLDDAVLVAAKLAELEKWDRLYIEKRKTNTERFLEELLKQVQLPVPFLRNTYMENFLSEAASLLLVNKQPTIRLQCLECNFSL